MIKADFSDLSKDAIANAEALTPVGSHYMRQLGGGALEHNSQNRLYSL